MLIHRKKTNSSSMNSVSVPLSVVALFVLTLLIGASIGGGVIFGTDGLWKSPLGELDNWMSRRGLNAFEGKKSSIDSALLSLPLRYLSSIGQTPNIPTISLDVKFKHIQQLRAKRATALEVGVLVQESGDFVPAKLSIEDRQVKVKIRLKGDRLDHLQDNKWSLRVELKGDDHVLGMRRFSLQHPVVRTFHGEPMFMETLYHMGVLGVRYQFVNLSINGESLGIMALEEHFSKELLESRGKLEGIIMRFDESAFWEHTSLHANWRQSPYNSFRNANIDAFRSKRIQKSEKMSAQYETIAGLVRSFSSGNIPASQLFDAEIAARYLAVLELWGSWHSIQWNDMRFYVNPITLKLEPIGYDAHPTLKSGNEKPTLQREPIFRAMLADPIIRSRYLEQLRLLARDALDGELHKKLNAIQDRLLPLLQNEFYLLEPMDLGKLQKRAKSLLTLSDNEILQIAEKYPRRIRYPKLVHANLIENDSGHFLELASAIPEPVTIESVKWGSDKLGLPREALTQKMPLKLPPTLFRQSPVYQKFYLAEDLIIDGSKILITARYPNWPIPVEIEPITYYPSLASSSIPQSTIKEQLRKHSFLSFDESSNTLFVQRGVWEVNDDIIVPKGASLLVSEGVTLEFAPGKALIAHGSIQMTGTEQQPIQMKGVHDEKWQGLAVLNAGEKSSLNYVNVSDTIGILRGAWQLLGGLTFYQSDVSLENVSIKRHMAEDALNIVKSQFIIEGLDIDTTLSDGFDADFSNGSISNSVFSNIGLKQGGDAIDVSGSKVLVKGVKFYGVSDKALSVGEGSYMNASNVEMNRVGTAVASKDGSQTDVQDILINQAYVAGLMAYTKKPEFGRASINAHNVTSDAPGAVGRVQTGSEITVDDKPLSAEYLDVDLLYETVMNKRATSAAIAPLE